MDRRSMLGGCVGAVLGGIRFRGAAACEAGMGDAIGKSERQYSIAGMTYNEVLTPEGKKLALWILGLHAHSRGSGKKSCGTIADWMRMIPFDDPKCVVLSEKLDDGGDHLYFVCLLDDETHEFVGIPVKTDRWSWDSGQRDRMLLGTADDGKPQFLEAYHLRADEQVEDVLDMAFPPRMYVAHSNPNRASYQVIT